MAKTTTSADLQIVHLPIDDLPPRHTPKLRPPPNQAEEDHLVGVGGRAGCG